MINRIDAPVLCLGEALVDIIVRDDQTTERVGGSPLNVACGLAALEHPTLLASWWGKDARGKAIEQFALDHGVGVVPGSNGAEATPIAYARLDEQGKASYEFELTWSVPELPAPTSWLICTPAASPPP